MTGFEALLKRMAITYLTRIDVSGGLNSQKHFAPALTCASVFSLVEAAT